MPADVVHVIEDDDVVRDSLASLLQSAGFEVQTYGSGTAFLAELPKSNVGCVVTDLRMPTLSGIDLLRRLRDLDIDLPVIVITGYGDVPLAVEAMKTGAADFIEKPFDTEALVAVISTTLREKRDDALHHQGRAEIAERLATLSQREGQVLQGLTAGHSNKTIAYNLAISPRTVETYRANVMNKMKATSLSDLVRIAIIAGVVNSQP